MSDSPFTDEFNKLNRVIADFKGKLNEFKGNREEFRQTIKFKIDDINKLIGEISVNGITQKQAEIDRLNKNLLGSEQQNHLLNEKNQELTKQKKELEATLLELESEKKALETKLLELVSEKKALETKLDNSIYISESALTANAEHQKALQTCEENIQKIQSEKNILDQKQNNHENEMESLLRNQTNTSKKLNDTDVENKKLKTQIESGKAHINEVSNDILRFVSEINNLDVEDKNIGNEVERIMQALIVLKDKLNNPMMKSLSRQNLSKFSYDKTSPNSQDNFVNGLKDILTRNTSQKDPIIEILKTNGSDLSNFFIEDAGRLIKLFNEIDQPRYEQIINIINKSPLFSGGKPKSKKRKIMKPKNSKGKRINKMRRTNKRRKSFRGGWTYKGSPSLDSKSSVITESSKTKSEKTKSRSNKIKSNKKHKSKKVIRRYKR